MFSYKKLLLFLGLLTILVGFGTAGFLYYEKSSQHADSKVNKPQINTEIDENSEPRLVVQVGHSGAISSAAYSPDGRFIITGGIEDRVAILWEAATGREIRRFIGHQNQINSVAFSPDGNFVVTASGGGEFGESESEIKDFTIRLWDVRDGKLVKKFDGHSELVNAVTFSTDGKNVLSASDDKTARIWDVDSGNEIKSLSHDALVKSVAYSPDGRYALTGGGDWSGWGNTECEDCFAQLWNTDSWEIKQSFENQKRSIGSVAFSPDNKFILLGGITPKRDNELIDSDGDIDFYVSQWNIETSEKIRDYKGLGPATFSSDGKFIVTASEGVLIWDAQTGLEIQSIKRSSKDIDVTAGVARAIAISPDNSDILVGLDTIKSSGNFIAEFGEKDAFIYSTNSARKKLDLSGDILKHSITALIFGVNPIGESENFIQVGENVWDKSSGKKLSFRGMKVESSVEPKKLSRDGKLLLSKYAVWNTTTGQKINSFKNDGHAGWITPNNKFVLFESVWEEGFLFSLFDIWTGKLKWEYKIKGDTSMASTRYINQDEARSTLSPDGRYVYTVAPKEIIKTEYETDEDFETDEELNTSENVPQKTEGYELLFIETKSGKVVKRFSLPDVSSTSSGIHVSPNGRYIDLIGLVFDTKEERVIKLEGGTGVFTPASNSIIVEDTDLLEPQKSNQPKLTNLKTGKVIKSLPFQLGTIRRAKFSPDGSKILVHSRYDVDGNYEVNLFNISTGKEIYKLQHSDVITSNSFLANGKHILTSSADGSSRIWSVETGKELCRLTSFKNGDWIVTTPDGRFDTNNLDNIDGMHWVLPSEPLRLLPIEIFLRQFYEPRLLARVLEEEEFSPVPSLSQLNRTQPEVKITDIKSNENDTLEVTVEVASVKSKTQKDVNGNAVESGVFDFRLLRNGQLVGYAPKTEESETNANSENAILSWIWSWFEEEKKEDKNLIPKPEIKSEVDLDEYGKAVLKFSNIKKPKTGVKELEFSAYAFNYDQVKSQTDRRTYEIVPETKKGRAYVVSLGVNAYELEKMNLRFAANDARQSQEGLIKRLKQREQYEEVIGIPLISDFEVTTSDGNTIAAQDASVQQVRQGSKKVIENNATKIKLKTVLDVLAGRKVSSDEAKEILKSIPNAEKLRPANPEDLIIITASTHGYTGKDGVFYLVPSDTGKTEILSEEFRLRSISSDELSFWLRDVDAGELALVVDACYSSSAVESDDFKPAPMNSRGLGQLSYDKGMRILTATQSDNVALETNKVRQGLLSYALLQDGLNDWKADFKPKNKEIELSEWLGYGVERVPQLYEEIKKDQLSKTTKLVRETVDTNESEQTTRIEKQLEKTQQPSLFDFSRRREVTIAKQ